MELNEIKEWIVGMPIGKNWGVTFDDKSSVRIYNVDGVYLLRASWRVPAKFDEDPGSVYCGCPLQGQSHMHQEREFTPGEVDALMAEYVVAVERIRRRSAPEFANSYRVGGH